MPSGADAAGPHDQVRLRLLDTVSYDGRTVTGERSHALLAALVADAGRAVSETALAEAVWGRDDLPAAPAKALQVVVSRTRSQTAADVVVRAERGYRLGLPADAVDATHLRRLAEEAQHAEAVNDLTAALAAARAVVDAEVAPADDEGAALEELRADARDLGAEIRPVLGRVASRLGHHDDALPLLEAVADPDEVTLAALLRSEAAVRGAPAALERYERHRADVRDRLGVDPGPVLQGVHGELLAADNPVRSGLRFEATSLVGRDDDVRALKTLVRESRVTSILGPGGLGKTRLAHLVGREAEQPIVHFVELVGVTAPDDVVVEVGTALGVRDSVSGRRALTADQRRNVRGRIAQVLDQAPTLLILDNCEHVVTAVADLVAFLVASTRDLRVVTTTRAPLGISAERVFPLAQLSVDDGVQLFQQRARSARPDVPLPPDAVRRVVERLDGLPLAIELAAARVRAMSVDDVARRLDDRFALLRGSDRSAPDRHQTLLAVIDWSWNLLEESERRALRRLSVFRDGFDLDAAEALLGVSAFGAVESLVSQSLLVVRERDGAVRYRMLETVREFGRVRLTEAGEDDEVHADRLRWATDRCRAVRPRLYSREQIPTVRAVTAEENNLTDVLHEALAAPDPATVALVMAALGGCWTIRGEHQRVIALATAVDAAFEGWEPTADEVAAATAAAAIVMVHVAIAEVTPAEACRRLLREHGERAADPDTRAMALVFASAEEVSYDDSFERLRGLAEHPERQVAMLALRWMSHWLENAGDGEGAAAAAEQALALWREDDGPAAQALTHTTLAGQYAQLGRMAEGARHAEACLDVLDALEATDDAVSLRAVLAFAALDRGDLDDAAAVLAEMERRHDRSAWGGTLAIETTRAELALAQGDVERGLSLYTGSVHAVRALRIPGFDMVEGHEPWRLYIESAALAAHAHFGSTESGQDLADVLAGVVVDVVSTDGRHMDYPIAGSVMMALGLWRLLHVQADDDALALITLAERFGYNRYVTSMAADLAREAAEAARPGRLDEIERRLGDRRGAAVRDDARALVARLF